MNAKLSIPAPASKLRAKTLRIGPDARTGRAAIELTLASGEIVYIILDPAHARAVAGRLAEVVDGRIVARPPSRRVLELELAEEPE